MIVQYVTTRMKLLHHVLLVTLEKKGVVGESAISVWVCNRGFWMYVWEDVCVWDFKNENKYEIFEKSENEWEKFF